MVGWAWIRRSAWDLRRELQWIIAVMVPVLLGLGCGSAGNPDTGYGAAQPVPATKSCADLCARSADVLVALCDEDLMSTKYINVRDFIQGQCEATCTDGQLQGVSSDASWQCLFQSSCRQVFGENVCKAMAPYSCNLRAADSDRGSVGAVIRRLRPAGAGLPASFLSLIGRKNSSGRKIIFGGRRD